MLRMKSAGKAAKVTLLSTILAAALGLALGLMSTPAQAHCAGKHKDHDPPHEHCVGETGTTTTYMVRLFEAGTGKSTDGAFCLRESAGDPCGEVKAIAATTGTRLFGVPTIAMIRPTEADPTGHQATWDDVFATCPGLFDAPVESLPDIGWWRINVDYSGGGCPHPVH